MLDSTPVVMGHCLAMVWLLCYKVSDSLGSHFVYSSATCKLLLLFFLTVPSITSVTVTSSLGNPVRVGSTVMVTCAVELSAVVMESELSLLTVTAQLTGGGNTLTPSGPTISGSTLTYSFTLGPLLRTHSDNYTCTTTIGPASTFLTAAEIGQLSNIIAITTGKPIQVSVQEN